MTAREKAYLEGFRAANGGGGGDSNRGGGRGKGKGKGKTNDDGKGAGKGKGKNTRGWWECPVALCTKHHGGQPYWNHPGRDACQACHVPRAAAAAHKAAAQDQDLQKLREAAAEEQKKLGDKQKKDAQKLKEKEEREKKEKDKALKEAEQKRLQTPKKVQPQQPKQAAPAKAEDGLDNLLSDLEDSPMEEGEGKAIELPQEFLEIQKELREPGKLKEDWSMEARMRPFMPDSPPGDVEEMKDQIQK
jgi:hypothetical protein